VLGKGSFGKAYLVKNTELDEFCVVKQMETSMMGKKEREEAVKEAMLLKRMDHKNIVRFQEVFMTRKGRLCIVMDYADGGDIHMEIKRRDSNLIAESQILEWFVQTCFALRHVHERKVLHRDLKTQNIFLMATGQVKLGDFGIARVLDATKDYAKTMVGTPYYLSPEIIEDRPYNFKSDIWSLGVVLYEMTTLKHPFDADSLVILASKILKDQYPPPDGVYSGDLAALIKSTLSKDAKLRPSVKEILEQPFLYASMVESNSRFSLGLDLSDFAQVLPASSTAAPPSEPEQDKEEGGEEDEEDYDEDFEDYSEPEDREEPPQSELQQSVANLKLDGSGSIAEASPSATMRPGGTDTAVSRPGDGSNSKIGSKADSLRVYLRGQLGAREYEEAYALVRRSAEGNADDLQRSMCDIIGADKAPELLTLFQLLCFLEDVSSCSRAEE